MNILRIICLLLISSSSAFECYLNFAKNSCWQNYEIQGYIIAPEVNGGEILAKFNLSEKEQFKKIKFKNIPEALIRVVIDYNPKVFKDFETKEQESEFFAKKLWIIPYKKDENVAQWHIDLCFPNDFSGIHNSNVADKNCKCTK